MKIVLMVEICFHAVTRGYTYGLRERDVQRERETKPHEMNHFIIYDVCVRIMVKYM